MNNLFSKSIVDRCIPIFNELNELSNLDRIEIINALKIELHKLSPMKNEPVDCVLWISTEEVQANDYNPNSVAPPEMKLLEHSVEEDGFTQPIVAWKTENKYEVVDGFHRNRVANESRNVKERLLGYVPLTIVNTDRLDRGDRIASTIRHNRARGKHRIDSMSDIVIELKRRNWSDLKIGKELGMDPDEILRLTQITGLAQMFADKEFSKSWEAAESLEINQDDDLSTNKENLPSLQIVGGLESGNVSGNTISNSSISNRCIVKIIENADSVKNGDAESCKIVAHRVRSKSKQSGKKPSSMVGAVSVLSDNDNTGLPYETGVAHPKSKPAKPSKRRSGFSD